MRIAECHQVLRIGGGGIPLAFNGVASVPALGNHEIDFVPLFGSPIVDRFQRKRQKQIQNDMLPKQAAVFGPEFAPSTDIADESCVESIGFRFTPKDSISLKSTGSNVRERFRPARLSRNFCVAAKVEDPVAKMRRSGKPYDGRLFPAFPDFRNPTRPINHANGVTINFDLYPHYAPCFAGSLAPRDVCASLSVVAGKEIVPGKTLLFLDKIQQCPRAIMALRYFYEKLPALHVIAAGSLLEFALTAEEMRIPVGRVQYLFMYPLTFAEFLEATNQQPALRSMNEQDANQAYPDAIQQHLLSLLRIYLTIGGMPALVREYAASGNMTLCARIQGG